MSEERRDSNPAEVEIKSVSRISSLASILQFGCTLIIIVKNILVDPNHSGSVVAFQFDLLYDIFVLKRKLKKNKS